MENIKKAIYYLQGMSKYNMEINKAVEKAEEELEYLLEVVSNRHIVIDVDRNKHQKTLDYIWRFKPKYNRQMPSNDRYLKRTEIKEALSLSWTQVKGLIRSHTVSGWRSTYDIEEFKKHTRGPKNDS